MIKWELKKNQPKQNIEEHEMKLFKLKMISTCIYPSNGYQSLIHPSIHPSAYQRVREWIWLDYVYITRRKHFQLSGIWYLGISAFCIFFFHSGITYICTYILRLLHQPYKLICINFWNAFYAFRTNQMELTKKRVETSGDGDGENVFWGQNPYGFCMLNEIERILLCKSLWLNGITLKRNCATIDAIKNFIGFQRRKSMQWKTFVHGAACDWNSEWVELSWVAAKGDECKQFKCMRNSVSNWLWIY